MFTVCTVQISNWVYLSKKKLRKKEITENPLLRCVVFCVLWGLFPRPMAFGTVFWSVREGIFTFVF